MDEVDGMSAGDRGGVGALLALIKKTKVLRLFALHYVDSDSGFDRYQSFV